MAKIAIANDKDEEFIFNYEAAAGVTANCGMATLFNISAYGTVASPSSFGGRRVMENREDTTRLWNDNIGGILKQLLGSIALRAKGIIVLSDLISEEGRLHDSYSYNTRHLIKYLIQNKIGSVALSPIVTNPQYSTGCHDIQAAFWTPPMYAGSEVLPGTYHPHGKGNTDDYSVYPPGRQLRGRQERYAAWYNAP